MQRAVKVAYFLPDPPPRLGQRELKSIIHTYHVHGSWVTYSCEGLDVIAVDWVVHFIGSLNDWQTEVSLLE